MGSFGAADSLHWMLNTGHSVYFVEEIHELLEVDFVVRLHAGYFDHSIHFVICYLLAQDFEHLLKVLSAYVSLPIESKC